MKRLVILVFVSMVPFLVCGCGGEKAPETAQTDQTSQAAQVPDKDEELGKHLIMLVDTMPPSAAFALDNIRLAVRMYPDESRRALMKVIEKQHSGWLGALKLLPDLMDKEIPGLKETMLKVWRQDGYFLGKTESVAILVKLGSYEAADEVLAFLKEKGKSAFNSDYVDCAPMLKYGKPKGTEEFALSVLEQNPLPGDEKVAPMAEVFGAIAPDKAVPILEKLLYSEDLNEKGYVGVVRGLGACGNDDAKAALFKFCEFLQDIFDQNQLLKVRKYGRSMIAAQGELARFPGEDVWDYFLLHETSAYNGFGDDYDRVQKLVEFIPAEYKAATAQKWAYPAWANDKKHKPTYLQNKQKIKGEVMLGKNLDETFKQSQLAKVKKFKSNPMYDANMNMHLLNLGKFAKAGDQEIIALFREIAASTGQERFTSRYYARQVLQQMKDEYLIEVVVKDDFYSDMSDWNRLGEFEPRVIPGLSDKFLAKEHKSIHEKGKGLSGMVFRFLACEARDDVLQRIESEIMKLLPDPRRTLVYTWLEGLKMWPGDAPERISRAIIAFYEKDGFTWESSTMGALDGERMGVLRTAWAILAERGDRQAFSNFYRIKPAMYMQPWGGPPEVFNAFMSKDYGPVTWFWPTEEEIFATKK